MFYTEQALQTMSIALRGDGHYELKAALPDIGWRIRKHYFLVSLYFTFNPKSTHVCMNTELIC